MPQGVTSPVPHELLVHAVLNIGNLNQSEEPILLNT